MNLAHGHYGFALRPFALNHRLHIQGHFRVATEAELLALLTLAACDCLGHNIDTASDHVTGRMGVIGIDVVLLGGRIA